MTKFIEVTPVESSSGPILINVSAVYSVVRQRDGNGCVLWRELRIAKIGTFAKPHMLIVTESYDAVARMLGVLHD